MEQGGHVAVYGVLEKESSHAALLARIKHDNDLPADEHFDCSQATSTDRCQT